jgi:hypothetical protein
MSFLEGAEFDLILTLKLIQGLIQFFSVQRGQFLPQMKNWQIVICVEFLI